MNGATLARKGHQGKTNQALSRQREDKTVGQPLQRHPRLAAPRHDHAAAVTRQLTIGSRENDPWRAPRRERPTERAERVQDRRQREAAAVTPSAESGTQRAVHLLIR